MILATLAAAAAYIEAVVKVELTLDAQGKVVTCAVIESNANAEVNDLTCQQMVASARFTNANGVEKTVTTVRYRVPAPPSPE